MHHIDHIRLHKTSLDMRWAILRCMREWFWQQHFIEVETPIILGLPGQEPYLSPMELTVHNEQGRAFSAYLHTSPEYTLKKMLAAGYTNIFSLTKTFRDYESFGGTHNPEFTMIEWYRTNATIVDLMNDVEQLMRQVCSYIGQHYPEQQERLEFINLPQGIRRVSMKELWQETIQINLDEYLTTESLYTLSISKGYHPQKEERYEDVFYRIFLNEIEPRLSSMGVVMLHHYPAQMAALSRLSPDDSRYAERVEVYIDGIELANGFSELTHAQEQRDRLVREQQHRKELGKTVYPIDEEFIAAVQQLPSCAGIALGVDRLVQLVTGCKNINDVLVLPMSRMVDSV